jgi:glycosyltransferase involved in cell wall biosynthesis
MKIIAQVHNYPPIQNSGAEWMLHEQLKFLVNSGHDVRVILPITGLKEYEFEGVKVSIDNWTYSKDQLKNCDLIISHLNRAGRAINVAEYFHKPYIFIAHNTNYCDFINAKWNLTKNVYVIYNSEFTKTNQGLMSDSKVKPYRQGYICPSVVVHPPIDPKRYKVKKGKKLTLINLFERKGGLFFQDLARRLPEYEFLGVEGGYGRQEKCNLPNIEYMDNTPDARKFYSKTKILLMPSQYESYGRTAIEAIVSGIPVIANPTPGLKESLNGSGIFCDLNIDQWVEAIKNLSNPEEYKKASDTALKRFDEIQENTEKELDNMEHFIMDIYNKRI